MFIKSALSFQEVGTFNNLIVDYQSESDKVRPFIADFPSLENLNKCADHLSFSMEKRKVLQEVLIDQYKGVEFNPLCLENINSLLEEETYTVVTGHQLCLFTGPLFFIYKIVSNIKLCQQLSAQYPGKKFIPIYWMATEDHDFEEINHFNYFKDKVIWDTDQTGMVGTFHLNDMAVVKEQVRGLFEGMPEGETLIKIFNEAYDESNNLTQATRVVVNSLFGQYGVISLDASDGRLKHFAQSWMKDELELSFAASAFQDQLDSWPKNYKVQAKPREINLFYVKGDVRGRIVRMKNGFEVLNSDYSFSKEEIYAELDSFPERFSPNVILRPLYQETILPNIAYIGGGGEIAYWMLLKKIFEKRNIEFPLLVVRDSVLIVDKSALSKKDKLKLSDKELFSDPQEVLKAHATEMLNGKMNLDAEKEAILTQYESIKEKVALVDKNLQQTVQTDINKFLKGFDQLSGKVIRSEKRKNQDLETQLINFKERLFPNGGLQERHQNFSVFYQKWGQSFIENLIEELNPLERKFWILSEK